MLFREESLEELVECDATDFCWPFEVGVVCDGKIHLRQREELFARDVAGVAGLVRQQAEKIATNFQIEGRNAPPCKPGGQGFLGCCYTSSGLRVSFVQIQSAEKNRCDEEAEQSALPLEFHGDMLAYVSIFHTAICAPPRRGDAVTMHA